MLFCSICEYIFSIQFAANPRQFTANPRQFAANPGQFPVNPCQFTANPCQFAANPPLRADLSPPRERARTNPPAAMFPSPSTQGVRAAAVLTHLDGQCF